MTGEVLSDKQIRRLIKSKAIIDADPSLVNPSSLDLRLDKPVHRLLGSVKPLTGQNMDDLLNSGVVDTTHNSDKPEGFYLDKDQPYLFQIVESLNLPHSLCARVFNKSGRGRIGTSLRILSNQNSVYDFISFGYKGNLWAEVCATAFATVVDLGKTTMPQIRFYDGHPEPIKGWELELLLKDEKILLDKKDKPINFSEKELEETCKTGKLTFRADLSNKLLACRAKRDNRTLNLLKKGKYYPKDFFEEVLSSKGERTLTLYPGDFVLINPIEKIRLPPQYAAEIAEYSIEFGDLRCHYAGLINPGHGYNPSKISGSSIVFEVRARDTPYFLQHGQPLSNFCLYKMLETPEIKYEKVRSIHNKGLYNVLPTQFKKR